MMLSSCAVRSFCLSSKRSKMFQDVPRFSKMFQDNTESMAVTPNRETKKIKITMECKNLLRRNANNANVSKTCKESIHKHKVRTVHNPSANTFFRSFSIVLYPHQMSPACHAKQLFNFLPLTFPVAILLVTLLHCMATRFKSKNFVLKCSADMHRTLTKNTEGC